MGSNIHFSGYLKLETPYPIGQNATAKNGPGQNATGQNVPNFKTGQNATISITTFAGHLPCLPTWSTNKVNVQNIFMIYYWTLAQPAC